MGEGKGRWGCKGERERVDGGRGYMGERERVDGGGGGSV